MMERQNVTANPTSQRVRTNKTLFKGLQLNRSAVGTHPYQTLKLLLKGKKNDGIYELCGKNFYDKNYKNYQYHNARFSNSTIPSKQKDKVYDFNQPSHICSNHIEIM